MAILSSQQLKNRMVKFSVVAFFIFMVIYYSFGSSSNNTIETMHEEIDKVDTKTNIINREKNKVKATFVTLARNEDLWELLESIQSIEDRFNSKFKYDWVFLNDNQFTEEFIRETTKSISGETKYGVIPYDHWSFPIWIDMKRAEATRKKMKEDDIIYGDSIPYRHMCRYNSGFFFRHPLLDEYDYYWRVEPSVKFYCDIDYDIFKFMQDNDYEYGFTIALQEYIETIPTLWETTKKFLSENPKYEEINNSLELISNDKGETYNLCHFWSNFEIGKLDFFRSKAYRSYFEYLDNAGGFFYERWGDAPVHTLAVSLLMDKEKLHFFDDIGYYHGPYTNCPINKDIRAKGRCSCDPGKDITLNGSKCMNKFFNFHNMRKPL